MSDDTISRPWNVTATALHERLRAWLAAGRPAVVATVVDVEGSAYRRPGAKMAIDADGAPVGAVTPGCLEGPLSDLAAEVRGADAPRVETFDLTDDGPWGFGLGCNGVITVLLEPLDEGLGVALDALADGRDVLVATAVESTDPGVAVGDRSVPGDDGRAVAPRRDLPTSVVEGLDLDPERAAGGGESRLERVETERGTVAVFLDRLVAPPELLVFGHQHDVRPVVELARRVGFRVTVASARGARADGERFPSADRVVAVHPSAIEDAIRHPERTYVALMSHDFVDDRLALEALLDADVPYVGLMGPRKRFERMREAFAEEGVTLDRAALDRISTPIGLDLGGGEPTQIALGIVGEALAVHNGRSGGRLSERDGPIHPRAD